MKKIIFSFILLFSFNAYAEIKDCKYNLKLTENSDVIESLLTNKNYSYKNNSGKICFTDGDDGTLAFSLKNGKLSGPMEFEITSNSKPALYVYASSYTFMEQLANVNSMNPKDMKKMDKIMGKLDIIMEFYHDNGNKAYIMDMKKGDGSITSYRRDGSMDSITAVKNFKVHGESEIYDEKGKLYAVLKYKNDKLVSGKCVNERKNGAEWTKAEISNYEQGLQVDCN